MALILSGRVIVYTNEVPYEQDILRTNLYQLVDVSNLAETILGVGIGNPVLARGLPCDPVSPPGMSVTIGPGVFYSFQDLDATAYGVLPVDTNPNHKQYKQGINLDPQTFATPAPTTTPGDSRIYLIQGQFQTQDVNNVSRPYFNSVNPAMPIFNSNYDTRQDLVVLGVKAGTPAPSPVAPTPDAGYTALYYVTTLYGQTSIISGNITVVSGAPFITESLTQKISSASGDVKYVQFAQYQNQSPVYGSDVGALNALAVTLSPVPGSKTIGMKVSVKAANTNTAGVTLNVNSLGNDSVITSNGSAVVSGYIVANSIYEFSYRGSNVWQLMNPTVPASIPAGFEGNFYGTVAPLGYLQLTDTVPTTAVQNVSRTTYAALFAAIGTTWGVGDGSTTFTLPPGARVASIGSGGTGTGVVGNAVGNKGGEETNTLGIGQIPSHTHDLTNYTGARNNAGGPPGSTDVGSASTNVTQAAGGGGAHNNMPPCVVVLRCIKY